MNRIDYLAGSSIALALGLGAATAFAQAPAARPEASAETAMQDIVVTARRRAENIQDVPAAVTAVGAGALAARGIDDLQSIQKIAPGFAFASGVGSNLGGTASIRGQSQPDSTQISLDPSVGFYFDDVYIARQNGTFPSLFDVQSIQVIKGPQGTLFGRNTTGGALVVTSRQPELGKVAGYGVLTVGNYDNRQFQAGLNVPIGDDIAIRASGSINRRNGFAKSVVTGQNFDDAHNESWRVQALVRFSDAARLTLAYNGTHADQGAIGYVLSEVDTRIGPLTNGFPDFAQIGLVPGTAQIVSILQAISSPTGKVAGFNSLNEVFLAEQANPRRIYAGPLPGQQLDIRSYAATFDVELGAADLKIIGAHRTVNDRTTYDDDSSPFVLLDLVEGTRLTQKQDSLEARISGKAVGDRLDYIGGLYYFKESGSDAVLSDQLGFFRNYSLANVRNETYSAFVQLDYALTDQVNVTGGLRVGHDQRQIENSIYNNAPVLAACGLSAAINLDAAINGCRGIATGGFTQYAYQVGVNYKASDDLLLYATHKRGYRSGVVNERAVDTATAQPLDPEIIYDFEIGSKWKWSTAGDLRGVLNLSAYYSIFKNRQLSFIDASSTGITTILESAEKAHTWGFEAELAATYGDWLSVNASVAHTDPKYDTFIRRGSGLDVSSQPVANTPKWQANVGARLTQPLGDAVGRGFIQADYAYMSSQFFGFAPRASASDPGHSLVDVSVGIENLGGSRVQVKGFVKNVFDETYVTGALNLGFQGGNQTAFFGESVKSLGAPRTYGLELSFDF